MANIKAEYAASVALTKTLAGLASSATLVAGWETGEVDNTSNKYLDYLLGGKFKLGTGPSAAAVEVWVVAVESDGTYPDVFDGTSSAETVTSRNVLLGCGRLAASLATDATTGETAWMAPVSVASLFGGSCPKKFTVFVTHNTGVNLDGTEGSHSLDVTPVYATGV